jgi:hypothetical protein
VEQRLAALFASVGNALDSKTYTYSDSDYLVRKLLVKFLEDENALVASARHIPDPEQVVESILNYVISTEFTNDDPASWYRKAMAITVEFADFAHRNDMSEDSARYAALLPDGHPRVKRVLPVTASAARNALADWMAADPRLDAEAAEQVRKLYSLDDSADDVEAEFETLKAEALVAAGRMPEELLPIVAAFNLSFAQRSAISKALAAVRRRDRKGRFAREFGRLKLFFKSRGQFFSSSPRIVGPGRGENTYQVESKGDPNIPDGIYEVDAALGENIKAYLPKSAVKGLAGRKEVVAEDDKRFAIELDDFLKTKQDAPNNWTKSGNKFTTKDGKFTATKIDSNDAQKFIDKAKERGDEPIISGSGAGDAFDPADPDSFLITDNKGRTKGVAQDWAGVQEVSIASGADFGDMPEAGGNPEVGIEPEPEAISTDSGALDKSKLSPSLIGEGYNFSKDGDNSWRKDGHGPDGETYTVEQGANGKWIVGEITGSDPFAESRDLEVFDNALEAFEYANDLGRRPSDFDEDWVNDLIAEQEVGPDLGQDQPEVDSRIKIDPSNLSPELQEKYQETFDKFDQAIFSNDRQGIADMLSKAALDNDMPDEVYSVLSEARDWVANRNAVIENALSRASREDLENLLEDPEFAGWRDRLESAMIELAPFGQDGYDYDLDQDTAPALSEKQAEPATGKQYAMLSEFLEERNLDPATEQALADAIENKNLNKAQASALIGLSRAADFKEGVDPSKPSERMLNSLQGYLSTKDLTPSEINDTLKSLEADSSRDNVEALLNKLRRKKDKPADLNQGTGSLRKITDDTYEWSDAYNYVDVMKTPNGWEVFYTNPDLNDRGGQTSHSQAFKSEEEALAFAEELVKQNQEGKDYDRAADDLAASVDLDQDQPTKPSLEEAATDKQYSFLESLLNGKKIDDPNLEAAARTAVRDKNLTKGEVGAFIGALRNLPDRPNVRREPTAKQVASIKRGIIERDFTPEQIKEIEDRLSSGVSFEEASEIIDDIKKRPVTAQGMNDLLDSLARNQDVDTLRYLLDKPEYAEYRTDIKDTLRQIAIDTEDPNLQEFIDGREEPDLDQDQPTRSVETKDLADQISKELDAIDFFTKNAASEAYDNFLNSDTASLAGSWIQDIRDFSEERDVPSELASKLQDLANRMEQEFIDRFGVADAARHSNDSSRDVMYLDDVALTVETEREMFFETDPDKIMDLMRTEDTYGDTRSGGAEIFVYQEEDGTYTAIVTYDRGSDEFTYDDRDDALAEAASAAADYNSDVMPSEYRDGELDELVEEAKNAKSPEDALDFADRIDGIAAALENSRGDLDVANSLREYGQRMREMAEKRQAFLESQLPNEPTTPETQEEMAADPDLNPAGYAKSVADDFAEQFLESEEFDGPTSGDGRPGPGTFTSKDGRIRVVVNSDGDLDDDRMVDTSNYDVFIDGEAVTPSSGIALKLSDVMADEIQGLVEDFFSKKD